MDHIRKSAEGGTEKFISEVRRKDRAGEYRYCEITGIFLMERDNFSYRMILVCRDTDELTRARIEERHVDRRFMRAVHDSYDGIYEGELYSDYLRQWKGEVQNSYFGFIPSITNRTEWAANEVVHPEQREEFRRKMSTENLKAEFESGKTEVTVRYKCLTLAGVCCWYSI